ncbi:hypothetical protein Z950_907 [Sulfitobacter mediterraneus KCTC 32188]|nr:hypothetical protein Z950_907 [Sulfitobacter mediterraneus KCTC 32188]
MILALIWVKCPDSLRQQTAGGGAKAAFYAGRNSIGLSGRW